MSQITRLSRRQSLSALGAASGLAVLAHPLAAAPAAPRRAARVPADARARIQERVDQTFMVDTHEHLLEEAERLQTPRHPRVRCDDWALLLSHYLDSDLRVAGMSAEAAGRFFSPDVDPLTKWPLLAPWWPAVKHTGYGQAVRLTCRELYGVNDLSADAIPRLQAGYQRVRRAGFYEEILVKRARIESCQVNCLTGEPFKESTQPSLLLQDLSIVGMFSGPAFDTYGRPTGIPVASLADWERVMRWWFERYGCFATAVKSQQAYGRDLDYLPTPAGAVEAVFAKVVRKEPVTAEERRRLEDHLFWRAVEMSTEAGLPVKLHTGYYAGQDGMPLSRVARNAGSASELCRQSPKTRFVFMHIDYPFYEDMIAVTKHYSNAYLDFCWAWIVNPLAAKDCLKKCLVSVPLTKLLVFGGDYIPVEPVLGHALIARRGIAQALTELVDEGWLDLAEALDLVEPLLRGNARTLFRLPEKQHAVARAPWVKPSLP